MTANTPVVRLDSAAIAGGAGPSLPRSLCWDRLGAPYPTPLIEPTRGCACHGGPLEDMCAVNRALYWTGLIRSCHRSPRYLRSCRQAHTRSRIGPVPLQRTKSRRPIPFSGQQSNRSPRSSFRVPLSLTWDHPSHITLRCLLDALPRDQVSSGYRRLTVRCQVQGHLRETILDIRSLLPLALAQTDPSR